MKFFVSRSFTTCGHKFKFYFEFTRYKINQILRRG